MAWNNSPEIVTQKEFEPVLSNNTFDAKKFLDLYSEWKHTHDTGTFAALRSMHQDAGYKNKNIIFGSESEMHEIATIVKNFLDKKTQITTTVTTETAAVAATNNSTVPNTNSTKSPNESSSHINNYNLKACSDYAHEHLTKYGKTMKEFQLALVTKMNIPLEITGVFDEATLIAVVRYNKDIIKNESGLVSDQTIQSLFGVTGIPSNPTPGSPDTIPWSTRRVDGLPEATRRPIVKPDIAPQAPVAPVPEPQTQAVPDSEPEKVEMAPLMKKFEWAMIEFRSAIKSVSDKSWVLFDTPEEIAKNKEIVNLALGKLLPILQTVESQKLSKEEKLVYDSAILEIARYFDNTLDGVKNRHYRNYDLAFDLALSLIQGDLKKQNINIPPRPSENDVLASLKDINPKLLKKIQKDLRAGYQLGQILSNPQVRSEWDDVYQKIYGKYEESMQNLLTKLKKDRPTLDSAEWQKALDTMISIMGTKDYWDLKARNRDLAGQTAGMVWSTVAWVGAVLLTPFTGGTSTIIGWALLGWAVTTAGMIATKWRWGLDRETGFELGINIVTLGAGGVIAKWANLLMKSGTIIARTAWITLDAAGGIGLGMSTDYVRAWEADTHITLSDSFKNNWYWALLPIAMGMKWPLKNKADAVQGHMNRANSQAHAGDTAGAHATIAQVEKEVADLAEKAKAQVQRESTATPQVPAKTPATNLHGEPIAPNTMAAKPNQAYIENNMKLSDADRIIQVEKRLWLQMTQVQKDALLEAHYAETILQKGRILNRKWEFSKDEVRILMEEGYAGRRQWLAPWVSPSPVPTTQQARVNNDRVASVAPHSKPVHVDQHTAHAVSEHTAKTANQTIAWWTDNKAIKLAWDFATKEILPGGTLRSILVFPANILRLPAINARKIAELWMKKWDKWFEFTPWWENVWKSVKIAALPSSEPFKWFTQSTLTLMTMGTVAYMTWQEVQKSNPNTPASLTWWLAIWYLKNMNYPLPIEFADWFFKNKINI